MKSTTTNSKNIKIRVTPQQYSYIETVAKENNTTISDVIRCSLFSESNINEYTAKIHKIIIIDQIHNLITAMNIPCNTKDLILKELNEIE